ncbi:FadR/GntR family transcriptional regulator [Clostridium sp. LBM24168]
MGIQKARRLTLVGQVAAQIEKMIESGRWKVGERIPTEPKLMSQFDVSRNTLREAIQSLVHVGLLETRQGIGTTVMSSSDLGLVLKRKIKKSNVLETLEVRLGLEREAAQLAAERRTEDDLKEIKRCLNECKGELKRNNFFEFVKKDIAFHKSVVKTTHNNMFIELYTHITDALENNINAILQSRNLLHSENEIHTNLFEAIRIGDEQLAFDSVNKYLGEAKELLSRMLNK